MEYPFLLKKILPVNYQFYSRKQLLSTDSSKLGVNIGSGVVSSIGLADDTILASDDIFNIQNLMTLIDDYCHRYKVNLVPNKTKLLPIGTKYDTNYIDYCRIVNPVKVGAVDIEFADSLEHVGVVRSSQGNFPAVSDRITAQKRAIGSIVSAG